jgi:hypothetical protein
MKLKKARARVIRLLDGESKYKLRSRHGGRKDYQVTNIVRNGTIKRIGDKLYRVYNGTYVCQEVRIKCLKNQK